MIPANPATTEPGTKENHEELCVRIRRSRIFSRVADGAGEINPTDPRRPARCARARLSRSPSSSYAKKAIAEKLVDQQVRDIDIGKPNRIGMVYAASSTSPRRNSVASTTRSARSITHLRPATLVSAGHRHRQRRPRRCAPSRVQRPGNKFGHPQRRRDQIKAGDVVVIPAGTGHWFTRIDDHISYLMVRIDPTSHAAEGERSPGLLSKPARKSEAARP